MVAGGLKVAKIMKDDAQMTTADSGIEVVEAESLRSDCHGALLSVQGALVVTEPPKYKGQVPKALSSIG